MKDVAKLADVDVSIVSKLINHDRSLSVRPATRTRVFEAIAKLDYKPNLAARNLRTRTSSAVGLVVPDFHNTVYSSIIEGAQNAAYERGQILLTVSTSQVDDPAKNIARVLGNDAIDGLLLAGGARADHLVELITAAGRPLISINRRIPAFDRSVVLDDAAAAEVAVQHLLRLGHTDIAFIGGPSDADTAERRAEGYLRAMRHAGLPTPDPFMVRADFTPRGGHNAMGQLAALRHRPSAVLVANVSSALGALSAARSARLTVPEDISIVAIHDDPLAEFASPPMTVVRMPLGELGRRGIELLLTVPADAKIDEIVAIPPAMIVRDSTAAVSR